MGKMAFRMRSSKFRHVYGSPAKKEMCYECIKITKNAHDSNFCAVNPRFVAIVTESAGGGAFLILPLEKVGRVDINAFKVCGHSGPVLDIKWNPFDDHVIASCSDDATIKLWQVPERGLTANLTEWRVDLHGHQRRVGHIAWHPTAQSILLSAGYDHKCILWNTDTAEPVNIISVHSETIFSIGWNLDGSLFATTSKDKKIRIIDPRQGHVINEGQGHAGSKSSKVVFVGNSNRLFTTGFSRMSERQYAVWDAKNLGRPLCMEVIDASSGVLFPFYDYDTNVVFVAGKGDGNIRYYELVHEHPYCHYLSQYQSSSPQRGLGIMPKRGIDPARCEMVRFYKLHAVKGICEPISMIVPRKSEMFQEDIFPPTASACPSLTADEWIAGQNRQPILISLKDGAISNCPVITTYKAVKRGVGAVTPTPTGPGAKRQSTAPPTATVAPSQGRFPSSLHNIRKMTGDDSDRENQNEELDNNDNNNSVNDRISSFEKKTGVNVTKSVMRMTNSNQPVRVERKIWSSTYTGVNANNGPAQPTNGMPRTDPERDTADAQQVNSNQQTEETTSTSHSSNRSQHRLHCDALEQAEQELYANLHLDSPPRQGRPKRKGSRHSDSSSEPFSTPPTSPMSSRSPSGSSNRPERDRSLLTESISSSPGTTPASWMTNPLYSTNNTQPLPPQSRDARRQASRAARGVKTPHPEQNTELSEAPQKRLFRSRSQRDAERSNNKVMSSTKTGTDAVTHANNKQSNTNCSIVVSSRVEENNNVINEAVLGSDEQTAYIELNGCFPSDAPDHTLMKPSKLRASLRGRRRLTNGCSSDYPTAESTNSREVSNASTTTTSSSTTTTPATTSPPLSTRQRRQPTTSNASNGPVRNVIIIENKSRARSSIASCTAQEKLPYISSAAVSYTYSNAAGAEQQSHPFDSLNANTSDALVKPSRLRDSFRRQRNRQKAIENEYNTEQGSDVRSTSPGPSPTSPPPSRTTAMPLTENELRKAYFRQVEEISSLKEQISLKDKRIRQLEEEVRLLRDGRCGMVDESTC